MDFEIRQIRPQEGLQLRALRLSALRDAPMAFGSTFAREDAFPDSVWHERAASGASGTDRVTFIAEEGARWLGLATGLADDPANRGHAPMLVGMFVDRERRGTGVGGALIEAVATWAQARGATSLYLWVTSTNTRLSRCTKDAASYVPRRASPSRILHLFLRS